jgi:hypothetical protein
MCPCVALHRDFVEKKKKTELTFAPGLKGAMATDIPIKLDTNPNG